MTNLEKLRHFVGSHGDWDRFGVCSLPFVTSSLGFIKTYLVCESGGKDVFESAYPDTTDVIEKTSEIRAKIALEQLIKPKTVETEVLV